MGALARCFGEPNPRWRPFPDATCATVLSLSSSFSRVDVTGISVALERRTGFVNVLRGDADMFEQATGT